MTDRLDLRRRLQATAFRQAGFFTAATALALGYSYQAQKYHVDCGNWVRVDRALFRLADWPSGSDDPYARWSVWSEGAGVISHESAAAVHDLGDLDPGLIHLTMARSRPDRPGVAIHQGTLTTIDVVDRGAFRLTSALRTLLDLASTDITQEQLDTVVVDALATHLVGSSALRRRIDDFGPAAALRLERAIAVSAAT